jgi:hypothetical protein
MKKPDALQIFLPKFFNTRIIHDVWRLLILSNEEKRMIMKFFKKEWFIWNSCKKRGRRKRNPCPMRLMTDFDLFYSHLLSQSGNNTVLLMLFVIMTGSLTHFSLK